MRTKNCGAAVSWPIQIAGVQLALRASVAAAIAIALAQLFQFQNLIYVFIAAVIVTDLKPSESRRLAWRRIVATVVGAVCGALLGPILPFSAWSIGLGVLAAMFVCQLVQVPDGAKVAGFICGIILLDDSAQPWTDALHRFGETVLGVVVAWAVSCVPKLIRIEELQK
jgi:uncharacterized membrane protein YgaE (UPF0421/DUF939 family)